MCPASICAVWVLSVMRKNGPRRDQRTDINKLDFINYNLLSPYTVQKDVQGTGDFKNLRYASGELSDIYSFHSAKIRNSALVKGIRFMR